MFVVVIPAYQPDQALLSVVEGLLPLLADRGFVKIIVVDDGSTVAASALVFASLVKLPAVLVLKHETNLGKGAALKTAFAYVLDNLPNITVVVTADADGQHLVRDIVQVGEKALSESKVVLGVRTIDHRVPARSRFGNVLTRRLFRLVSNVNIIDTQTGLRGIPRRNLIKLIAIPYNRYNFEFEALIQVTREGPLIQLPIETVYEPGNPSSHFNPLLDSARIYAIFARHLSVVTVIGLLDWMLFTAVSATGLSILASLIAARTLSTVVYFVVARNYVFRSRGNVLKQVALFLLLVASNILLLWPFITVAYNELGLPKSLAMLIGYLFLFVSNFLWQNYIVFQRQETDQ